MLMIMYSHTGARGGTSQLFKEALLLNGNTGPDYSGIVYLAPSHLKTKTARDLFHSITGGTYVSPLMATPLQLAKRFCQTSSEKLLLPSYLRAPLLAKILSAKGSRSEVAYSVLLSDLMLELKTRFPGVTQDAFSKEILRPAVNELGIPAEVALRLENALEIIGRYDSILGEKNVLDEADSFFAARNFTTETLRNKIILLDGFFELSPPEKIFLAPLLSEARDALALVPLDEKYQELTEDILNFLKGFEHLESEIQGKDYSAPSYYPYPSREEEIESIARKIKAACLSKNAAQVIANTNVFFPSGTEYFNMAERVFSKYGIPCSLDPGASHAVRTGDLLSLLDSGISGEINELARIINSPLYSAIPEKLARWGPKITLKGSSYNDINDLLSFPGAPKEELKWLRRKLSGLKKVFLEKVASFSKISRAYLETLRGLGFAPEGAGKILSERLEDSLKGLAFLDLVENSEIPEQSAREMQETLRYVIGSVKGEDEKSGVRILPFTQASAFLEPDSLHFAGLLDGTVPARPELDFFLPERLRARLGLRTMKYQLLIDEFLFRKLVSSSKDIHLSFPQMEGDKVYLPSVFISEGNVLKDPVYGIFSHEEELLRKGKVKNYDDSIEEIKIKKGPQKTLRITEIDRYRECPRMFFIENILGVAPLEREEYELEPKVAGTLLHSVMEKLCPVRADDINLLNERAVKIFEEVFSKTDDLLDPFWKELLKENFLSALPDIMEIEQDFRKEGYEFQLAEEKLEGAINGIKLKGKIDRIDKNPNGGCQILDYKTGHIELNGKNVLEKGATLQLFLYAALARQKGIHSVRVGLYSLKDLKVKFIPGRSDKKANRTLEDYVSSSVSYLDKTVELLKKGLFMARPLSDLKCRKCSEKPYCPLIHSKTGEKNGN